VLDESDIQQGRSPGVGGVFYVMMEEDHGGKDKVRAEVEARAQRLRELLVQNVEGSKWSSWAVPVSLKAISDELMKAGGVGGGGCGLLNTRACKFFRDRLGDDFIDFNGVVYVGISPSYLATLEPSWRGVASAFGQTWPDCNSPTTPVCPAASDSHLLEFRGEGAFYRLEVDASFTPN
jgi:hypothetical protein